MGAQTVGDEARNGINALQEQTCQLRKQNEIIKAIEILYLDARAKCYGIPLFVY